MINVETRKSKRLGREGFWVADVGNAGYVQAGYVQLDGTNGRYIDYPTKDAANNARNLFLMKNGIEEKKERYCEDCTNKPECKIWRGQPASSCVDYDWNNKTIMNQEIKNTPTGTKDTNPKEALGIKKVSTYCIPTGPLLELGLAFMEGGRKYGAHNYRAMGARHSVYLDAIERHRLAHLEGQDLDPDSGLYHLAKIMGCCAVLLDSIMMGNDIDDRPIQYPGGLDMTKYSKMAEEIIKKYPDCVEPYTEENKNIDRTKPVEGGY